MGRIALIAGATGLVGRDLLTLLLDDSDIAEVVVLARRAIPTPHPKLTQGIVAFDQLRNFVLPAVDDFYCCLGTTLRQAGSKEALREVDLVYPVTIARMAIAAGAARCFFVSAMGADEKSSHFYNRIKGEAEGALMRLEWRAAYAFRPSLLVGDRRDFRAGERAALALARPLAFLLPANFRPIAGSDVASAMHACGRRDAAGRFIIASDEIRRIARGPQFSRLAASPRP